MALAASTALGFAGMAWRFDLGVDLIVYSYLAAVAVPLAAIDLAEQRLPNTLVAPSYAVTGGLMVLSGHGGWHLLRAAAGMAVVGLFLLVLALLSGGLGAGDVKLGGLLGMATGWIGWTTLLAGVLLGWFLALLVLLPPCRCPLARAAPIPLGPPLLLGAFLALAAPTG
ncbi:prepilin peptidase [Actinokineospora sp. NPDC004072]